MHDIAKEWNDMKPEKKSWYKYSFVYMLIYWWL